MAATKYTITTDQVNIVEYENYSEKDQALIDSFKVNSLFDVNSHFIELHIYSLDGRKLESDYNYTRHKQLLNSESAGKEGAVNLAIDPIEDTKEYGYTKGGVRLLYHYLSNLFSLDNSRNFYIETISPDRTEVRLLSTKFSDQDILDKVTELKARFAEDPYFNEIRLNFSNNDLFIGINIDTEEYEGRTAVLVKLYEPLPEAYTEKDILYIVEQVSDSTQYTVDSITEAERSESIKLRGPNFDLEVSEEAVVPTEFLSYNELFAYPITSSYNEIHSIVAEKGIRLSIDYADFSNFVKFSSAEERVRNFAYKVGLIESYETQIVAAKSSTAALTPQTGSISYFENLIKGIVENFDGYERFLYYESGSVAWPKTNSSKPYLNAGTGSTAAINWVLEQTTSASYYDNNNPSALRYTLPEFIKDNPDNESATVFLDMLGQHFDNLWLYADAVTEKYNSDNRLNYGISRDLVEDALKNFGVKLYTSNFSTDDLYTSLIDYVFNPGSELTGSFITVDEYEPYFLDQGLYNNWRVTPPPILDVSSTGDYTQEVYKRIYHNLAYLLKTKGTHRGVRALVNCFGIPKDILTIEEYGGVDRTQDFYLGYQLPSTSSFDKIRLDNTGSIVGTTLSSLTSIQQPDEKYNQDLHTVEVGFSPTTNINNYIVSQSAVLFESRSIDDYIGDPTTRRDRSYIGLDKHAKTVLADVTRYDLFDFVRLLRFFDNTVFKMVKDFTPARSAVTTGLVIKPHILDRSKIQSPVMTWTRTEYSASIDTAFIEGSEGNVITSSYSTNHNIRVSTLLGDVNKSVIDNSPLYNGELNGTQVTVATQSLNVDNNLLSIQQPNITYDVNYYKLNNLAQASAFTGSLASGEIKVGYFDYNPGGPKAENIPDRVRMSTESLESLNLLKYIYNTTNISFNGYDYTPQNMSADFDGGSGVYFSLISSGKRLPSVTSGTELQVFFSPYLAEDITYSEYNAVLNNATDLRRSNVYLQVDRFSDILPQNLSAINNGSAIHAEVQDSNYSSLAITEGRYNGTKNTVGSFNTGSGLNAQYSAGTYIGYYDNAEYGSLTGGPYDGGQFMRMKLKYLLDTSGNIIQVTGDEETESILEQNFISSAIPKSLDMSIATPFSSSKAANTFTAVALDNSYVANSTDLLGIRPSGAPSFDQTNKEGLVYPKGLEQTSAKETLTKAKQILRFAGLI
jgi:hypothetical protein